MSTVTTCCSCIRVTRTVSSSALRPENESARDSPEGNDQMSLVGYGTWRDTRDDEAALRDERSALTWRELDAVLNRSTNALLARDTGPDRRIAVFAENSIETVLAYLTGILAGCSGVPINYHLRAE